MFPTGDTRFYGKGKRKSAVARVWLVPGSGNVYVRKWRVMPKGDDVTVSYIDSKTGERVEEKAIFPEDLANGTYAVPRTERAGKKPFRYTPMEEYFGRETLRMLIDQPFQITKTAGEFDVFVNVRGGGLSGQAGAIRHGIAVALLAYEQSKGPTTVVIPATEEGGEEETVQQLPVRRALKKAGMLTRDARVKERKKYGQPGARKRYQFSKR